MLHMRISVDGYSANEKQWRRIAESAGRKRIQSFFWSFLKAILQNRTQNTYTAWTEPRSHPINYVFLKTIWIQGHEARCIWNLTGLIELCGKASNIYHHRPACVAGSSNQHCIATIPPIKHYSGSIRTFKTGHWHLWEVIEIIIKTRPWVPAMIWLTNRRTYRWKIVPYYKCLYDAVRKVDPNHIMFLKEIVMLLIW